MNGSRDHGLFGGHVWLALENLLWLRLMLLLLLTLLLLSLLELSLHGRLHKHLVRFISLSNLHDVVIHFVWQNGKLFRVQSLLFQCASLSNH